MNREDVSVVITTRNEEHNIAGCLRSVMRQTYPRDRLDIVVVDNNSTDRTRKIASQFPARVFNCGPERSAQRNFGIARSRGAYVLYLDADMILEEGVVSECVSACEKENRVAVYIPERIIGDGFWIRVRDFERGFYDATCIDAVRFVRKEAALRIGGFDENLNGPEDWDFDRRIKEEGKAGIIGSCLYHDEGSFSLARYVRKKAYYLPGLEKYAAKWGRKDPIIRKQLGFWYRYVEVFTENGKWRRVAAHPLLFLGVCALRARVGLSYTLHGAAAGSRSL